MKYIEDLESLATEACVAFEDMVCYAPSLFYNPHSPFARLRHEVNEMRRALEAYPYGA